jgi:hypothetical protein
MTMVDEDIKTDELDRLAAERGYHYRIQQTKPTYYAWTVYRPGASRPAGSGGISSLEEAVDNVKEVLKESEKYEAGKVYYNDDVLGTVITREEFIKLDPGEVYDNLMCCGAEAVIFRHVDTGHVAVEDGDSVWVE